MEQVKEKQQLPSVNPGKRTKVSGYGYQLSLLAEGYNWEKDEADVGPAMLFHGNIKTHVYKSVGQPNKWK